MTHDDLRRLLPGQAPAPGRTALDATPWPRSARGKGKIFAFIGGDAVGIKAGANRDSEDEWLARYPDEAWVMAYIGRAGWNTLRLGGATPDDELEEAIDAFLDLGCPRA